MTYRYDEQNKTNTKMCWTEDNRMQAYVQMNEGEEQVIKLQLGWGVLCAWRREKIEKHCDEFKTRE